MTNNVKNIEFMESDSYSNAVAESLGFKLCNNSNTKDSISIRQLKKSSNIRRIRAFFIKMMYLIKEFLKFDFKERRILLSEKGKSSGSVRKRKMYHNECNSVITPPVNTQNNTQGTINVYIINNVNNYIYNHNGNNETYISYDSKFSISIINLIIDLLFKIVPLFVSIISKIL